MKIKSLEELKEIRDKNKNKVNLRHHGNNEDGEIEILVGMATCGISAGARDTLNTIVKEINDGRIENVKVVPVGCLGYCHREPIIQVNIPNQEPVFYGDVKKDKVEEIIKNHIIGGNPVSKLVIDIGFDRA